MCKCSTVVVDGTFDHYYKKAIDAHVFIFFEYEYYNGIFLTIFYYFGYDGF